MEMKMELSVILLVLLPCISTVTAYPKKSELIPKDSYKRQILQPIPGYIPVYIKPDEQPLVIKKLESSQLLNRAMTKKAEWKNSGEEIRPRITDDLQGKNKAPESKEDEEKETKLLKSKEKYEKMKTSQHPKA